MIPKDNVFCLRSEAATGKLIIYKIEFIDDKHVYYTSPAVKENQAALYKSANVDDTISIDEAFDLVLNYARELEYVIVELQNELNELQRNYIKNPNKFIQNHMAEEC